MMPLQEKTASEWFHDAERAYLEGHQACAWCGESHRVFKSERGGRLEYYCCGCDFYASRDAASGQYRAVEGQASALVGLPSPGDGLG